MKMIYCKRCVLPNTKPGVKFNSDGICSACISVEIKHKTDWKKREKKLDEICNQVRGSNGNGYECIVPASGGKDSTYQAYVMSKKYNLKVLCVNVVAHLQTYVLERKLDKDPGTRTIQVLEDQQLELRFCHC